MDNIMKIVLEILAGVGGIGVIFAAVVGFSSSFIADKLQKKYQLILDEELEKYKAGLSNKIYISKTKFDAEFEIYRKLSDSFSKCVKTFNILIPYGLTTVLADKVKKKEQDEKNYKDSVNAYAIAQDELEKSIPFIPSNIVDEYNAILKLCSLQLFDFEERWNVSFIGSEEEKSSLKMESYKRTNEINEQYKKVNELIRDYLSRLDVL